MSDDGNYEKLKAAVVELDAAMLEQDKHVDTWGYWYQRDEIVTFRDRLAEDKIHTEERRIKRRVSSAIEALITAAREYTK